MRPGAVRPPTRTPARTRPSGRPNVPGPRPAAAGSRTPIPAAHPSRERVRARGRARSRGPQGGAAGDARRRLGMGLAFAAHGWVVRRVTLNPAVDEPRDLVDAAVEHGAEDAAAG